ncbi:MAG: class I SAM-dependent methyltransferase [Chloroflexi bacterium]|jgi:SAM-dependent methyltransferase|nr:class I SAM-dependent methyltransferase [Chloroflexota bacterium]MBT4072645.1 class I SAM-dependent methyltransferase [Chloroflexota bacterium]MBT4515159.1 class I SAM-dependent methyltransferase [Chloroflexota bacterium]MBT6682585.1 class I SAM-dependent methyltransferase [Chloroflexota bacterium]
MSTKSDGPAPNQGGVEWVYSSTNPEQLEARYDTWSATYDEEMGQRYGWSAPQMTVPVVQKHVPVTGRILDAGVGTGLVGQFLSEVGYTDLTGIDFSSEMLAQARLKNVYQVLRQMELGKPLDFATNIFDAVTCVGVLTLGHAPASSLDEMVRVTKPGGHVIYSMRPDYRETAGFVEKEAELTDAGLWKLAEVTDPVHTMPIGIPDALMQIWAFEVIG